MYREIFRRIEIWMNFETLLNKKKLSASELIEEEIIRYMTYVEILYIVISGKKLKGQQAATTSQKNSIVCTDFEYIEIQKKTTYNQPSPPIESMSKITSPKKYLLKKLK